VAALRTILDDPSRSPSLQQFTAARHKEKELTKQITELVIRAAVVALDREDISALANRLYRVPKTVEKFAERYLISFEQVRMVNFQRQLELMERAVKTVREMVIGLRNSLELAAIKQLNANMQKIESDADDLILEVTGQLYQPGYPPLRAIIARDLFELNEKVVDRCRDAGNVITRVVLKNS
jgi:uncharacterized protein Yka (UPF0111/DUF47 family)